MIGKICVICRTPIEDSNWTNISDGEVEGAMTDPNNIAHAICAYGVAGLPNQHKLITPEQRVQRRLATIKELCSKRNLLHNELRVKDQQRAKLEVHIKRLTMEIKLLDEQLLGEHGQIDYLFSLQSTQPMQQQPERWWTMVIRYLKALYAPVLMMFLLTGCTAGTPPPGPSPALQAIYAPSAPAIPPIIHPVKTTRPPHYVIQLVLTYKDGTKGIIPYTTTQQCFADLEESKKNPFVVTRECQSLTKKNRLLVVDTTPPIPGPVTVTKTLLAPTGGPYNVWLINPCRAVDTRVSGGRIPAGTVRAVVLVDVMQNQGGQPTCGIPLTAKGIFMNIVAVYPTTAGYLTAYPWPSGAPATSIINYTAGTVIANNTVITICDHTTTACYFDLSVYSSSEVDLVIDITGFLLNP